MSEQSLKMTLYICNKCNLLLLRIDTIESCQVLNSLREDGWYDSQESTELEIDDYLCPCCLETSTRDDQDKKDQLKSIVVPIPAAKSLIKYWESHTADEYTWGIPLDDQNLPDAVLEHLL